LINAIHIANLCFIHKEYLSVCFFAAKSSKPTIFNISKIFSFLVQVSSECINKFSYPVFFSYKLEDSITEPIYFSVSIFQSFHNTLIFQLVFLINPQSIFSVVDFHAPFAQIKP
jgi:hypothetical protein